MAPDQRYCLSCGARRAEARLDFLEILRGAPGAAPHPAAPAPRPGAPTTAVVAAGGAQHRVQGGGGTAAAAEPEAKKRQPGAGKQKDDVVEAASAEESKATNPALQELENASPEEYQKQSQKLPKELSTGGKPPPKDDKAPAAGGEFEEIG
jgi:hypothetical protein